MNNEMNNKIKKSKIEKYEQRLHEENNNENVYKKMGLASSILISSILIIVSITMIILYISYANEKMEEFKYEKFNGYIIDSTTLYNNSTNSYHLNMIAEKIESMNNCTYYDYAIGSLNTVNAIIYHDIGEKIKWSKIKNTNECVKFKKNKYLLNPIIIIIAITLLIFSPFCTIVYIWYDKIFTFK